MLHNMVTYLLHLNWKYNRKLEFLVDIFELICEDSDQGLFGVDIHYNGQILAEFFLVEVKGTVVEQ